ncbi:type II toxin-antitoxin system death-on-curing family toxin [Candidatus Omnitrophota bacterium]
MERITLQQVEHIAFSLARDFYTFDETILDFATRRSNILESCLETPFQTFDKRSLYPTFTAKVSMLFYLMVKNHPFQNGNKRIAMTTLLWALYKEKQWLRVETKTFYEFAVWVAKSLPNASNQVVTYIEKFIKTYVVPLEAK